MDKKLNKNNTDYMTVDNSVGKCRCGGSCTQEAAFNALITVKKDTEECFENQGNARLNDVHLASLHNIRVFVETLVKRLQKDVDNLWVNASDFSAIKEQNIPSNHMKYVWGEKESAASSLVKLTGLLTKIIAAERDVAKDMPSDENNAEHTNFSEADKALIEKYFTTQWRTKSYE